MTVFRLVLILLTGEELFLLLFCWIILTTVFPCFVNDREDASYLIVLFYLLKYWLHKAVVKLTKRGIYDFCLVATCCVNMKRLYMYFHGSTNKLCCVI